MLMPDDVDERNIIDKLAKFVARNGQKYEDLMKTKQKDNPKFSFLFGGGYSEYYRWKVNTKAQQIHELKQKALELEQQVEEIQGEIEHVKQGNAQSSEKTPSSCQESEIASLSSSDVQDNKKVNQCDMCGKRFSTSHKLKRHLLGHQHNTRYQPREMSELKEKALELEQQVEELQRRIENAKQPNAQSLEKMPSCSEESKIVPMSSNDVQDNEKINLCDVCGKGFSTSHRLKRHLLCHQDNRPYQCKECSKCFKRASNLIDHIPTHSSERPYQCDKCGKCFKKSSALFKHSRTHQNIRSYKCDECGQAFKTFSAWRVHCRRLHQDNRPFQCQECNKCFLFPSNLNEHLLTHKEKPHPCNECDKAFRNYPGLLRHLINHRNERLYKCNECDKSFNHEVYLTRHLRIHRRLDSNEVPDNKGKRQCLECGKYVTKLNRHLLIHKNKKLSDENEKEVRNKLLKSPVVKLDDIMLSSSPKQSTKRVSRKVTSPDRVRTCKKNYQCMECGKYFSKATNRNLHSQIHKTERPHKCETCDKGFKSLVTLHGHTRVHKEKIPSQCDTCDKSFISHGALCSHMQVHKNQCETCGKSFKSSVTLRRHMLSLCSHAIGDKSLTQHAGLASHQKENQDALSVDLSMTDDESEDVNVVDAMPEHTISLHSTMANSVPDNNSAQCLMANQIDVIPTSAKETFQSPDMSNIHQQQLKVSIPLNDQQQEVLTQQEAKRKVTHPNISNHFPPQKKSTNDLTKEKERERVRENDEIDVSSSKPCQYSSWPLPEDILTSAAVTHMTNFQKTLGTLTSQEIECTTAPAITSAASPTVVEPTEDEKILVLDSPLKTENSLDVSKWTLESNADDQIMKDIKPICNAIVDHWFYALSPINENNKSPTDIRTDRNDESKKVTRRTRLRPTMVQLNREHVDNKESETFNNLQNESCIYADSNLVKLVDFGKELPLLHVENLNENNNILDKMQEQNEQTQHRLVSGHLKRHFGVHTQEKLASPDILQLCHTTNRFDQNDTVSSNQEISLTAAPLNPITEKTSPANLIIHAADNQIAEPANLKEKAASANLNNQKGLNLNASKEKVPTIMDFTPMPAAMKPPAGFKFARTLALVSMLVPDDATTMDGSQIKVEEYTDETQCSSQIQRDSEGVP